MRILALMTEAFGALGGIQKFNRDWLRALAGLETVEAIHVLVRRQSMDARAPTGITQQCPAFGKAGFVISAMRQAMGLGPGDLIICGHVHLAPLAIAVSKVSGAKTWLHMHGVEAWEDPGTTIRRSVAAMSLISIASRFTRRRLLEWSDVSPHHVKVLPNVVDERFKPGPVPADLRSGLDLNGKKVLLTVSRLASNEAYKGQDRIIRALPKIISKIPEAMYLIVGDGDDVRRLQKLAEALSVESHIRFLGRVDDDGLVALYRLADLFVMPSEGEGFGIVYLEAMACGCPALGLDAGGSIDALGSSPLGHTCSDENLLQVIVEQLKSPSRSTSSDDSAFSSQAFTRHVSALTRAVAPQRAGSP